MRLVALLAVLILLQACATPSLGRMHPLLPTERDVLDCDGIAVEIRKTDEFCATSLETKGYSNLSAGVTLMMGIGGFLSPAPYNNLELVKAMKSATIRRSQLTYEAGASGCPEDERPEVERMLACPPLCSRPAFLAALTMEAGFLGERCIALNRQERNSYRHLLDG